MSFPRYPAYKPSGVEWLGDVPAHWEVVRLKRVSHIQYGIGEPPQYHDTGVPLIRATNVHAGKILRTGIVFIDPSEIPAQRALWLRAGDIIVVRSGAYAGDSATVSASELPAIAGFDMVLSCHSVLPQFVQWSLLSHYLKERQIDLERMRAAQPHLNAEELGACWLFSPPASEQRAISSFLDREATKIDALIAEQERLIALLAEKRQAMISHAVTKGLNPDVPMKYSGNESIGLIPAHWTAVRLKSMFRQEKRTGNPHLQVLSVYRDFGVILKSARDDNHNKTPEDVSVYQLVRQGDLVINKMKAWQGSLGIAEDEGITSPDYAVFSPTHPQLSRYIHHLLRSRPLVSTYRGISSGIRLEQWRLEPDAFLSIHVHLPPLEEQSRIATHLEELELGCAQLATEAQRAIELLRERRAALISAAVTGQIDVRGAVEASS